MWTIKSSIEIDVKTMKALNWAGMLQVTENNLGGWTSEEDEANGNTEQTPEGVVTTQVSPGDPPISGSNKVRLHHQTHNQDLHHYISLFSSFFAKLKAC